MVGWGGGVPGVEKIESGSMDTLGLVYTLPTPRPEYGIQKDQ